MFAQWQHCDLDKQETMLHGYGYGVQKFCKNQSMSMSIYIYLKIQKFYKFHKIKTKIFTS